MITRIAQRRSSGIQVFTDWVRVCACALAMGSREDEYEEIKRRYNEEEMSAFASGFADLVMEMESKPFADVLGVHYLEVASVSTMQARGEFYTPQPICDLMAAITFGADQVIQEGKPITLQEPACGAGATVLAVAKTLAPDHVHLLRVTAMDLNPTATDMAYVNFSLWGIAAEILTGDTLRMEFRARHTTMRWRMLGEDLRRAFRAITQMMETEACTSPNSPPKVANEVVPDVQASVSLDSPVSPANAVQMELF